MVEKKPRTLTIEGFEMLEKVAKLPNKASSCIIYLPKEWEGKEVVIIRVE